MNDVGKKKAYVGMSGGVDSSVSALLLKNEGYDVTGVFIKVWQPDSGECTWKDERRDAMRVCAHLDIPLLTLDLTDTYKKEVVDYLIREYRQGRTPNGDVMCNKHVKFGGFYDFAMKKGADIVATGHYADTKEIGASDLNEKNIVTMVESKDKDKDQTYFLWTITGKQLKNVRFPVGGMQKKEVRKIAEAYNLPVATKKDSQGICFIGHLDMKDFLKEYIEVKKGDVLDEGGNIIGSHEGAVLYTIGERHGFTLFTKTTTEVPHYIVSKDIEKNTITVSPGVLMAPGVSQEAKIEKEFNLVQVNWISGTRPPEDKEIECRMRYRERRKRCKVGHKDGAYTLRMIDEPSYPAPGQSVVFYDGNVCIGGAILGE